MESSLPERWNPGRQSSVHSAPRQIPIWTSARSAMCMASSFPKSWNPGRRSWDEWLVSCAPMGVQIGIRQATSDIQSDIQSQLCTMPHSRESWRRPLQHRMESTNIRELLCEFTTICKNILTCLSVTQMGLIDDCPFKTVPLRLSL
jgi:hypothetical protein